MNKINYYLSQPDQVPLDENVIVSKYISSPLVIDGECKQHHISVILIWLGYITVFMYIVYLICCASQNLHHEFPVFYYILHS